MLGAKLVAVPGGVNCLAHPFLRGIFPLLTYSVHLLLIHSWPAAFCMSPCHRKTVQNHRRILSEVTAPKRDRVLNVVVAAFVVTIAPLPVGSVYGTRCLTCAIILSAGHGGRHL